MDNVEEPPDSALWPLHPQPRHFEPLTLWLERVARAYGLRYRSFCRYGLGLEHLTITELCESPSEAVLEKISAGTGVPTSRLRAMTIGSLILQLQAELQVAVGKHEAQVVAWLTDQCRISYYSRSSDYWEAIEFWKRENDERKRR